MKNQKKHVFRHTDPESAQQKPAVQTEPGSKKEKRPAKNTVPEFVYRDLKRTGLIISIFIVLIVAVYFIQTKTQLLQPVLRIFGL